MAFPFGKFPTLGDFIKSAVAQGCIEKATEGKLKGPRGEIQSRYLTRPDPGAPIAVLPNIGEDEPLTPIVLGQLVRTLKVQGHEHLILDP
jgi:hypothetical protein